MQEQRKWLKGGPSPNPVGRPRRKPTISAALREGFPPARIRSMVEKLCQSEDESIQKWAVEFLTNRLEGKPQDNLHVTTGAAFDDDDESAAEQLTDAQHDALAALDAARDRVLAGDVDATRHDHQSDVTTGYTSPLSPSKIIDLPTV